MASFLQKSPNQYTPYIPKYDVALYGQIGMMKQAQYNQGVEQIQGTIDAVAGLPVGREVDRQYLQQRIGEVTSQANQAGTSDFSDQSIVSRLRTLATGVANDTKVQSAVSAAQAYKKQLTNMEAAQKEGKSAVYNDWDFQRQVADWQKDPEVGKAFTGAYTPYKDVRKKALEALKSLTKDSSITDDAFTIDASGKVVLSDAITRTKLGGLSPQKIKAAIAASLDAGDMHQLSIEGDYSYSNKSPEELTRLISQAHQADIEALTEKKTLIAAQRDGLKDGAQRTALNQRLAELDKEIGSVAEDNKAYGDLIGKGEVRQARANYYTTQFLRNFSNSFAFQDVSQTYESSPMVQVQMERSKMEQSARQWTADYQMKESHFQAKYTQDERAHKEKMALESGEYGRINLPVDQSQLPEVNMGNFQKQTEALQTVLHSREADFLRSQGKDPAWLATQRLQYEKSPSSVTPALKDFFDNTLHQEKALRTNQQLITQLNEEADKQGLTLSNIIPAGAPRVRFNRGNTTYDFSPEELVTFNSKLNSIKRSVTSQDTETGTGSMYGISSVGRKNLFDDALAAKILSPKEKLLYDIKKKQYEGKPLNSVEQEVDGTLTQYHSSTNRQYEGVIKQRQEFLSKALADRTGEAQRAVYQLPVGKGEQRAAVRGLFQSFIDRAQDTKQSLGDGVDVEELAKLNVDDDATYSITTKPSTVLGPAQYWLTVGKGDNIQRFPITEQDKRDLMGNRYEDRNQNAFAPVAQQLRMTNNGTTNLSGVSDPIKASANAFLSPSDFSSVKNFTVKGDIYQQNGRYGLSLYVYNPLTKQVVPIDFAPPSGLMDEQAVLTAVPLLNDAAIYKHLTGEDLTPEVLQQIQEENKKAN